MANPLELPAARAHVVARVEPTTRAELTALADAHGRVLAAPACTDGPWPAPDRSAMDGFAVAAGAEGLPDGVALPVVGESLAGKPFPRALVSGEAIRIMTGAVVPDGADAVVPVENTSGYEGETVSFTGRVEAGANVRLMGSERGAGVEVLAAGRRLYAAEIGALAVLGRHQVEVVARPKVAIVATGDEVVPVDQQPLPHQVRESNSWALAAQVAECGGVAVRCGIAPDEVDGLRAMLEDALADADFVLTIGGISKGTHDLVHDTLATLGVQTEFHGIKLKPGKPTYFGVRDHGDRQQYVFGLPGNPASTFTVFDLLVRPAIKRWHGSDPGVWGARVDLGDTTWKKNWRMQAVPAELVAGEGGRVVARMAKPTPSGDPFSLLNGSCYALVPPDTAREDVETIELSGGSRGVDLP
ncbi:MAG: gephyrin-like molybdotransferase Glp [Planctomycetota bacterium]|nr:gephyrin-like molybdotransferase Glp [Planctomycetota bacterium]